MSSLNLKCSQRAEIVDDHPSEGDVAGVVQLCQDQDGRLPLQVLGHEGVLVLVKRHHLRSHFIVQIDLSARSTLPKGVWGQLVVTD